MRRYEEDFNEEYGRGYRAGRRQAMREMKEISNELPDEVKEALKWSTKYRVLVIFSGSKVKFYLDKEEDEFDSIQLVPPVVINYFFGKKVNGLADGEYRRILEDAGYKKIARIYL